MLASLTIMYIVPNWLLEATTQNWSNSNNNQSPSNHLQPPATQDVMNLEQSSADSVAPVIPMLPIAPGESLLVMEGMDTTGQQHHELLAGADFPTTLDYTTINEITTDWTTTADSPTTLDYVTDAFTTDLSTTDPPTTLEYATDETTTDVPTTFDFTGDALTADMTTDLTTITTNDFTTTAAADSAVTTPTPLLVNVQPLSLTQYIVQIFTG